MRRSVVRIIRYAAAVALVSGVMSSSLQAVSPAEYRNTIQRTAAVLEYVQSSEKGYRESEQPRLDKLAATLPSSITITQDDGSSSNIDFSWIKQDLGSISRLRGKDRANQIDLLVKRVQNLKSADRLPATQTALDTQKAEAALSEVLSRREYRSSVVESWIVRINRQLQELLSRINVSPEVADVVYWIIVCASILACIIAIVVVVRMILGRQSPGSQEEQAPQRRKIDKPVRQSLEALMMMAEQEASQGHYRDAFRYVYLASITLLDRSRLITYTDSSTNWEYLRALKKQSKNEAADVFLIMTRLFDESIYGHREISGEDYRTSRSGYQRLEALV